MKTKTTMNDELKARIPALVWMGLLWGGVAVAEMELWTSTAGTTLEARFAGLEGDMVLLEAGQGDVRRVRLDLLQPGDQERARRLASAITKAAREDNPDHWLPVWGREPYPDAFAVFQDPAFDFVIRGDGQGILFIKNAHGQTLRPGIRIGQFRIHYRKPGNPRVFPRPVVELTEAPAAPVLNPKDLVLKGVAEDQVRFERRYRYQPGNVQIDFEFSEPRNQRFPALVNMPVQFARTGPRDEDEDLEKRLEVVGTWSMVVHHDRRQTEFNFRDSFERFPENAERIVIRGPWDQRELTLTFTGATPNLQRYPLSPLFRGFGLLSRIGGPQAPGNRMSMTFSVK